MNERGMHTGGAGAEGGAGSIADALGDHADSTPSRTLAPATARTPAPSPESAPALAALYVPGDRPDRVAKALASGADIVIIDLEDAVAASAKEAARSSASAALAEALANSASAEALVSPSPPSTGDRATDSPAVSGLSIRATSAAAELPRDPAVNLGRRRSAVPRIQVRVNAPGSPWHDDDLAMVAALPGDIGVRVPKVSGAETVARVRARLGAHAGSPTTADTREVHALIETALGVERAFEIASSGVATLALGEADLRSELGLPAGLAGEPGLAWLRSRVVNAAAAAGLEPPMMSVYADVRDLDGLGSSCRAGRSLGFCGRAAIHPAQLPVIREAFLPTTAEAERARAIVDRVASASAAGSGTVVLEDGTFLDIAMVRAARRTLALAEAASAER